MRLVNMLLQPGGVAEQGLEISFALRYMQGRVPSTRQVTATMLPMSDRDWADVERLTNEALAETVDKDGKTLPPRSNLQRNVEWNIQFLRVCLRDPGDLGQRLIEDERDVQALRDGLVGPQHEWFATQYRALMMEEYPAFFKEKDVKDLHADAANFSKGAQQ